MLAKPVNPLKETMEAPRQIHAFRLQVVRACAGSFHRPIRCCLDLQLSANNIDYVDPAFCPVGAAGFANHGLCHALQELEHELSSAQLVCRKRTRITSLAHPLDRAGKLRLEPHADQGRSVQDRVQTHSENGRANRDNAHRGRGAGIWSSKRRASILVG